jgi:hypothetical protein
MLESDRKLAREMKLSQGNQDIKDLVKKAE